MRSEMVYGSECWAIDMKMKHEDDCIVRETRILIDQDDLGIF